MTRTTRTRAATVEAPRLVLMGIKFSPEVRTIILDEVHRRKRLGLPNRSIQDVVTEAVVKTFGKKR